MQFADSFTKGSGRGTKGSSHFDGSDLPSIEGFSVTMEQISASHSAMALKCRNALGESLCQGLVPG